MKILKLLDMVMNKIINVGAPVNDNDATTKKYVDDGLATKMTKTTYDSTGSGIVDNSEAIGGKAEDELMKYNDVIMNTNAFGGKKLYRSTLNNAMFRLDDRYTITGKFYNKSDDSYGSDVSSTDIGDLFDGNYESYLIIPLGQYVKIEIDFGGTWSGYPYGYVFLSHYYSGIQESSKLRVYCTYEPHGIGWHEFDFADYFVATNKQIMRARQSKYGISHMEIIVNSPDAGETAKVSQVDFQLDRPGTQEMPFVDKYKPNKLYDYLDMNSHNIKGLATPTADDHAVNKGFADGAYSPLSHAHSYLPLTGGILSGDLDIQNINAMLKIIGLSNGVSSLSLLEESGALKYGFQHLYDGAGNIYKFRTYNGTVDVPTEIFSVARGSNVVDFKNTPNVNGGGIYHTGNKPSASDVGAEPAFSKNSGFNKNLGNTAGTVAEGNHGHTLDAITETVSKKILTTLAQTITGIKTFASFPVTPSSAPTSDYQVANKKYVDDNAGGGTGGWKHIGSYTTDGDNQITIPDGAKSVRLVGRLVDSATTDAYLRVNGKTTTYDYSWIDLGDSTPAGGSSSSTSGFHVGDCDGGDCSIDITVSATPGGDFIYSGTVNMSSYPRVYHGHNFSGATSITSVELYGPGYDSGTSIDIWALYN